MKDRKIIVQISEGLGNQLFMYAHALSLSESLNRKLEIDNTTGYKRKKNLLRKHQQYSLNNFNLSAPLANDDFLINNNYYNLLKKLFLFIDIFKKKKTFYIEIKKKINGFKVVNQLTKFDNNELEDKIYILGNFENSKYFNNIRSKLLRDFTLKNQYIDFNNPLINKLKDSNSISIHIRRDRFSDQIGYESEVLKEQSIKFTNEIIEYINRAVLFFNNKINNPHYFLWTNNMDQIENLSKKINVANLTFVKSYNDINDFNLFKYSKHFIVGPSSFHWWGAWLNEYKDKICVRPSNLNPSNNVNFWPDEWLSL
jgi:hypothetical protein